MKGQEWNRVADKLPEKGKPVLMAFEQNMAVGYRYDGDETITYWSAYTDDGWTADCDCEPTHWMPLPEMPSNIEEEDRDAV